jgi:hypothetical protein
VAADEFRSTNVQIEHLLHRVLVDTGRVCPPAHGEAGNDSRRRVRPEGSTRRGIAITYAPLVKGARRLGACQPPWTSHHPYVRDADQDEARLRR